MNAYDRFLADFCALLGLGCAALLIWALVTDQHGGVGWLLLSIGCSTGTNLLCRRTRGQIRDHADSGSDAPNPTGSD